MKGTAYHALKALDIFQDFHGRRSGIIKALTTDFREFYQQCDPEEGEQCLVGLPNGTWEVTPPARMVSPDPRPVSGFHFGRNRMPGLPKRDREELFQRINELPTVCETVMEFGASKDQSAMMMLKKPESCSTVNMPSPHKGESGAAMEDGYNDGSSSYGQNKSSEMYVNSFSDDSGALKDESGAAIEDGHNDGSSSYGRSKFFVMYVNSSVDDSRGLKDDSGAAIEDGHNDGSGSSGQSKSSGMHVNSSVDESGAQKDGIGAAIEGGHLVV